MQSRRRNVMALCGSIVAASAMALGAIAVPLSGAAAPRTAATVIFSDTVLVPGTCPVNLDTGKTCGPATGIQWSIENSSGTQREIVSYNGFGLHNLGVVSFAKVSEAQLAKLTYTSNPLDGSPGKSDKLVTGDVFAVSLPKHQYAKVQVRVNAIPLKIRFVTYAS